VVHGVQVFQAFPGDMRINLGGRQIAVPQQHLHHAQIRAVIQQMRGKGVSQSMGRQLFFDAGFFE